MISAHQKTSCQGSDPSSNVPTGRPKSVLLFANFGLYHLARLAALETVADVTAVEFASHQKLYGWRLDKAITSKITTLFSGSLEDMSVPTFFSCASSLIKLLRTSNPSAVFIPGYVNPLCLTAAIWAKLNRRKSVLMFESTENDKKRHASVEMVKSTIIRVLFTDAIVGGYRTKAYLKKLGVPVGRIVDKYDIVDNDFFTKGTCHIREHNIGSNFNLPPRYFLCVARLAPEKNFPTLLEAYKYYLDSGGDWELVIVGKGPLLSKLHQAAKSTGYSQKIHLVGFKNLEEILPYYAFADCFVLCSTREPWGLVVNEAMACGLPVLVSDRCGCTPDLVRHGENGYTFDPNEVTELSGLLTQISTLPEEQLRALGQNSLGIIESYSVSNFAHSSQSILTRD